MDNIWFNIGCYLISIIFITSFIDKVKNWRMFQVKVAEYKLLPNSLIKPVNTVFIITDIYLGAMFLLMQINLLNVILLILMLVIYTSAVVINLYRGNTQISCGCSGVFENDRLSSLIVYRNAVLIVIGVLLLNVKITFKIEIAYGVILPLLISVSILLLYGVIKEFVEQNLLMKKLRTKLVYFEE